MIISKKCKGWKLARNIYVIPNIISSAAMGLIFLQLYNPKYGIINEIISVFVPNFEENILFIPKVNMIALTCAYIFFRRNKYDHGTWTDQCNSGRSPRSSITRWCQGMDVGSLYRLTTY